MVLSKVHSEATSTHLSMRHRWSSARCILRLPQARWVMLALATLALILLCATLFFLSERLSSHLASCLDVAKSLWKLEPMVLHALLCKPGTCKRARTYYAPNPPFFGSWE